MNGIGTLLTQPIQAVTLKDLRFAKRKTLPVVGVRFGGLHHSHFDGQFQSILPPRCPNKGRRRIQPKIRPNARSRAISNEFANMLLYCLKGCATWSGREDRKNGVSHFSRTLLRLDDRLVHAAEHKTFRRSVNDEVGKVLLPELFSLQGWPNRSQTCALSTEHRP